MERKGEAQEWVLDSLMRKWEPWSLRGTSWMKATVGLAMAVLLAKLADAALQVPEGTSLGA